MNQQKFRKRLNKLLAEERNNPLSVWYLSYADDYGFRGGVYLQAHGPAEATYLSNRRGYSPGGAVMVVGPLPADKIPDRKFWNRLLTKQDIEAANPGDECKTIEEFKAEENDGTKR